LILATGTSLNTISPGEQKIRPDWGSQSGLSFAMEVRMEVPVQTQVECKDGVCGHSVCVLIDPTDDEVTHVIIEENEAPHNEYLVPIKDTSRTIAGTLVLNISRAQLKTMDLFKRTHYIREKVPYIYDHGGIEEAMGAMYYWPYVTPDRNVEVPVEEYNIPEGGTALERGTRVKATDGYVGKVDELVINNRTKRITHLVMREGHLWGRKEVVIPVSAITKANGDTVSLNLDKDQIERLPVFPVKRNW
jgi:sporulation protein YlmC with PRC-barrel domain